MPEIYVSTDIEADGPIPGPHSMLSFGSAAYRADKTLIDTFSANLETLPEALPHPATMQWWETQPEAWDACRRDTESPEDVMPAYLDWIAGLPGRAIFVGYPAAFDFMFVNWYLYRFAGKSPFHHAGIDIKTYAMVLLKRDYHLCAKSSFPPAWIDPLPHTHVALDDAIEQGALFCNMLQANLRGGGVVCKEF